MSDQSTSAANPYAPTGAAPHHTYQAANAYPPPAGAGAYPAYGPGYPGGPSNYGSDFSKLNTYSILAIVFAFIFAPVGIVFGALARSLSHVPGAPQWMRTVGSLGFWLSLAFTALPFLLMLFALPFILRGANHTVFPNSNPSAVVCHADPTTGAVVCEGGSTRGAIRINPPGWTTNS